MAAGTAFSLALFRTYEARLQRLFGDFLEHNGSDDAGWFAWKEQLEKKSVQASDAAKSRFKKTPKKQDEQTNGGAAEEPPNPDMDVYAMKLPGGRKAELRLPRDADRSDVDRIWKMLEQWKGLITTQLDILTEDESEDEAGDQKLGFQFRGPPCRATRLRRAERRWVAVAGRSDDDDEALRQLQRGRGLKRVAGRPAVVLGDHRQARDLRLRG